MPPDSLPTPWKELLSEIAAMLAEPLSLHCIGGFVICYFYGLPRPTGDIDYYTAVPANLNLIEMAGEGSALAQKYKIRLHHVGVCAPPSRSLAHSGPFRVRIAEIVSS